ncbi:MAG: hypothetical protein K1X94_06735 [Sandaracinaceae bacterium]|nr:hypothetical protein [Sandaracinaceae bacterium]
MRLSRVLLVSLALGLAPLPLVLGCDGATTTVDVRYSTPEHTIATLFGAYGVEDLTQDEVRERMAGNGRFELRDRDTYLSCFSDLHTPTDEGLAGFVFGGLAAGKDDLRTTIAGETATISPRPGFEVVMHREDDGRWLISLDESVPAEVRTRLGMVAADFEHRQRRGQSTGTTVQ